MMPKFLTCSIAGIKVFVDGLEKFPISLLNDLRIFQTSSDDMPVLSIMCSDKEEDHQGFKLIIRGDTLEIGHDAGSNKTCFMYCRSPKCKMFLNYATNQAILCILPSVSTQEPELSEQARVLLRMVFEYVAVGKKILSLHASALVWHERGICVTGPSGAGKSTLSKNWLQSVPESYVLNADRPALRKDGNMFSVWGVPWSGKEHVFINKKAPLRAIVEVRQHCTNRIHQLDSGRAYRMLLKRISKPQWNSQAMLPLMETLAELVACIPVYRFYCVNDPSAGSFLRDALTHFESIPMIPKEEKDMKVKNGYIIRKVLNDYLAMPVESVSNNGAIMLNEVGAFLWEKLKDPITEEMLLEAELAEFEVDEETAKTDLREFLDMLRHAGALDEA